MRFENGVNNSSGVAEGRPTEKYQNGVKNGVTNGTTNGMLNGHASPQLGPIKQEKGPSASSFSALDKGDHDYHGHDKKEMTRIIMQALYEMGYKETARALEKESESHLENKEVARFRQAVLSGEWTTAEKLIQQLEIREDADINVLLFYIRQQKYLELLEAREMTKALMVLRGELVPLNQPPELLKILSSLIMCTSAEDMRERAEWDGAGGMSRQYLLTELSRHISPSSMVPEHRLATLLDEVKEIQIKRCIYHNTTESPSLYHDHMCAPSTFPSYQSKVLRAHHDEVWHIQFSPDGSRFATSSKDSTAIIWDATTFEPIHHLKGHNGAILLVSWSPDGNKLITCSSDRTAKVWDTQTAECILTTEEHGNGNNPVKGAAWAPDSQSFITGSPSKIIVHRDLTNKVLRTWPGIRCVALDISPDGKYMVVASGSNDDKAVYVYDFITREQKYRASIEKGVLHLSFSKDSRAVLLNTMTDQLFQEVAMMDVETGTIIRTFEGVRHHDNVLRSAFGGANENFVICGNDDSNIYIWNRDHGMLIAKLPGHIGVVNAVSWNPQDHNVFASAGDDGTVRIWTPPHHSLAKGKVKEEVFH